MSTVRFAPLLLLSVLAVAEAWAQAPVRVGPVETRALTKRVDATGTVTSPRAAVLSTAVAGLVAELSVDEGRRVEAGETLLTLDDELAGLALARARAEVRQREAALADTRRRLEEAERVGTDRGIARTQIESLRAETSGAEAALAAARAAAQEQQAVVARHALKAPFAGVISERYAELGEWVNPGDGLMELVATDNLRFDFRIAQDYYGDLMPDTPVTISLDAVPAKKIPGRIQTIVPVKNPGARTFLVRVLADAGTLGGGSGITPGMSASGRFSLATGRTGTVLSRDAILRFPDGRATVWVVETGEAGPVVRERIVTTGLEFDGLVEVSGGVSPGERVVVRGNETLQEGQTVRILDGDI